MMVVLLILMVATASAAVSIQTTQAELKASGHERVGMQAQYAAETAMATTVAWVDILCEGGRFLEVLRDWEAQSLAALDMRQFGEPDYTALTRHHAVRSTMIQHSALQNGDAVFGCPTACLPPLSVSGDAVGDMADNVGSFGPRQAYEPWRPNAPDDTRVDYVVDINDCMQAPSAAMPGAPVGGGASSTQIVQFYCVLTARGRVAINGASATREWGDDYIQEQFTAARDARATILTPQMIR